MALTKAEKTRKERTDAVLTMATDEAKKVHANRANGTVGVTASLDVSDDDGTNTTKDGASATVSLATSHEKTKNETK